VGLAARWGSDRQHDRVDGGDDGTAPHTDAEPRRTQAEDGRD
jgi:hypothetical protein